MSGSIRIFDTTLREGFGEADSAVSARQAVSIACALERAGVSTIEVGYPAQSQSQQEVTKAVATALTASEAAALASCDASEVAAAIEAVREARHPVVHVYLSAPAVHQAEIRTRTRRAIREAVSMVDGAGMSVQFSIAHIEAMERPFRRQCIDVAVNAGATRIGVPDSTGTMSVAEYANLVRDIVAFAGPRVAVSAHCHNASGQAVANAMAAIEAGARQVETTVRGIGTSGGNVSLEGIAESIRERYGTSPIDLTALAAIDVRGNEKRTQESAAIDDAGEGSASSAASPSGGRGWRCFVEVAAL